jgi:hypothetical protein
MNQVPQASIKPASQILQQRRHERYVVHTPGVLRLVGIRGGVYVITVLDVSKSGLCINCPMGVPQGTRVEVKCHGTMVSGTVRYAREVGSEFHVGIEADLAEAPAGTPPISELDLTPLLRNDATKRAKG